MGVEAQSHDGTWQPLPPYSLRQDQQDKPIFDIHWGYSLYEEEETKYNVSTAA